MCIDLISLSLVTAVWLGMWLILKVDWYDYDRALFIRAVSVIVCSEPLGIKQRLRIHHASFTAEEDEERRMSSGRKVKLCMTDLRSWSFVIWKCLRCSVFSCRNDIISTLLTHCEVKTKHFNKWVWSQQQTNTSSMNFMARIDGFWNNSSSENEFLLLSTNRLSQSHLFGLICCHGH